MISFDFMAFSKPRLRNDVTFVLTLSLWVAGCAHPTSEVVGEFGVGVATVSAVVADAATLDAELEIKTNLIIGGTSMANGLVSFPPQPGRFIRGKSDKDWKVRITALKGLAAYGKALTDINDPSRSSDAAAIASTIGEGISGVIKGSGTSAKRKLYADKADALAGIASDLFGLAIETYSAVAMRQAMERAHPKISELVMLLKEDLADVSLSLNVKQELYEEAVVKKLESFASDARLTTVEKYDRYLNASAEYAGFVERRKAVAGGAKALDDLLEAHEAILKSDDPKRAISTFTATIQGLAGHINKLEAAELAIKKASESRS